MIIVESNSRARIFILFVVFSLIHCSESYSQATTKIYVTGEGKLYTSHQVDSIAMLGYPIANKRKTQRNDTTFMEIEILEKPTTRSAFVSRFEGKSIPDLNLTDIEGKKLSSEKFKGKVVLINFWSTTCGPCIVEMPQLNELTKMYRDKVIFIGIAPEDIITIQRFLEKHEFEFILVSNYQIFKEFKIDGYPKNLFIDQNGIVIKAKEGTPISSESGKWKVSVLEDYSKILSDIIEGRL